MKRVAVIGGVSWNTMIYLPALPEPRSQTLFSNSAHETVGSTGAGKALNLCRLGFDVTLHAMLGDDQRGAAIRSYLAEHPLRLLWDIDPAGSKRHVNLMDSQGQRVSIFVDHGSARPDIDMGRIEALIDNSDIVVLGILPYCQPLIPVIQRQKKPLWIDIHAWNGQDDHHRPFIDAADMLLMSSDEMPAWEGFLRSIARSGVSPAICTHGAQGATAIDQNGQRVDSPSAEGFSLRDANGAGDAFCAGVLYGHVRGLNLEVCMRLGAIVAGLCIESTELAHPALDTARLHAEYEARFGPLADSPARPRNR